MLKMELDIIEDNRKKHNGNTDSELLDFAIQTLKSELSSQTIEVKQNIIKNFNFLSNQNDFVTFQHILKDVAGRLVYAIKENEKESGLMLKTFLKIANFQNDIIFMNKNELMGLLTDDAKQKYFGD
jgi:hypothetical protein